MNSWEMRIEKVFKFGDGRTVLTGQVHGHVDFISSCDCELWVGGKLHSKIRIEGEMIAVRSKRPDLRSVSTQEPLDIDDGLATREQCKLIYTAP